MSREFRRAQDQPAAPPKPVPQPPSVDQPPPRLSRSVAVPIFDPQNLHGRTANEVGELVLSIAALLRHRETDADPMAVVDPESARDRLRWVKTILQR